ncbi:MAG: HAD superfamily hydrolase (TIGR01509 family) [Gammaproteobacteria bacterium]|jgi:HAD superfamily hydrolase (TIGR01509 family)
MNQKDKTIIFDCDGVLVDSEVIYSAIERKHLVKIGLTYTNAEYQERFLGLTNDDYIYVLSVDYHGKYNKAFPTDYEKTITKESLLAFESELKEIEGAASFISTLKTPSAVASSSKLNALHRKLELTELRTLFGSHIYSGEQVPRGKPSPDLFLHSAKQLDVSPNQCVVVEDSANGVIAGVSAGMEVWDFIGGGHTNLDTASQLANVGAARVFTSYSSMSSYWFR